MMWVCYSSDVWQRACSAFSHCNWWHIRYFLVPYTETCFLENKYSRSVSPHGHVLGSLQPSGPAEVCSRLCRTGVRSNAALQSGEGLCWQVQQENHVIFMLYMLLLCLEVSAKSVSCAGNQGEKWDVTAPQMMWIQPSGSWSFSFSEPSRGKK